MSRSGCSRPRSTGSRRSGARSRSSSGGWSRRSRRALAPAAAPGPAPGRHRRDALRGHDRRGPARPGAAGHRAAGRRGRVPRARSVAACSPRTPTSAPGSPASACAGSGAVAELAAIGADGAIRRGGRAAPRPGPRRGDRAVPAAPAPERLVLAAARSSRAVDELEALRFVLHRLAGGPHRAARRARPGRGPGRPAPRAGSRVRAATGRHRSWPSSSASPSPPPTPRRSSASCSPGWSGPRRRPPSRGWTLELAGAEPAAGQQLPLFVPQAARDAPARLAAGAARADLRGGSGPAGRGARPGGAAARGALGVAGRWT